MDNRRVKYELGRFRDWSAETWDWLLGVRPYAITVEPERLWLEGDEKVAWIRVCYDNLDKQDNGVLYRVEDAIPCPIAELPEALGLLMNAMGTGVICGVTES